MQKNILYSNIVAATSSIVTQFGRSIVHDDRFVNILSDLYPERDNPAVYRIIKSAIQDDLLKPVLSANAKSIEHQVATATVALSKQYGYDQSLVECILFSLAVGYGSITSAQFNALVALRNKPTKKSPPASHNNPNSSPKQKNPPPQPPSKYKATLTNIILLIWGMLGLLYSPLFYAYRISVKSWWPMGASIVIALIQFVTILPNTSFFVSDDSNNNKHIHPALHGGYCALYMFAIAYWIIFPFIWSFESVQAYWGFLPNKEAFPWITTWFINIFCALLLVTFLGQAVSNLSNSLRKQKGKFLDNFQDLMTVRLYRLGFFSVTAFFLLAAFVLFSIPIVRESQYKKQIEEYNNKIEALNHHSDSIRNARSQTERNLSFAQFKLGDSFSSCVSKIKNEDNYSIFKDRGIDHLEMNEKDYINIVDSIIQLRTDWNNEKITLYMYFSNQRLVAIEFSPEKTNSDSLLSVYTSKYGEPESYLYKYVPSEYEAF